MLIKGRALKLSIQVKYLNIRTCCVKKIAVCTVACLISCLGAYTYHLLRDNIMHIEVQVSLLVKWRKETLRVIGQSYCVYMKKCLLEGKITARDQAHMQYKRGGWLNTNRYAWHSDFHLPINELISSCIPECHSLKSFYKEKAATEDDGE